MSAIGNLFVRTVNSQSMETTDQMKEDAENQYKVVLNNYSSEHGSEYKDVLTKEMQSLGYRDYEDVKEYLINYYKQQKILEEYIEKHSDELKIRNISYLLVKFEESEDTADTVNEEIVIDESDSKEDEESTEETETTEEHTPTEDEQSRMNAVDKAFDEGREFASIAEEFSEDPSTASEGGVLGTIDSNTTTLDKAFLEAALELEEGETSDWVYSETFGYFRIHCNATSVENLEKIYREKNEVPEETEIKLGEMYTNLLSDYDNTLLGKAIWEKGQELGVTFADKDIENKIRTYLSVETLEDEEEEVSENTSATPEETVNPEKVSENTEGKESTESEEISEESSEVKTEEKPDAE